MAVQHRYRRFPFSELRPQALLFLIVLTLTAGIIVPPITGKADALVFYPGGYIRVAQTLGYGNSFYLLWENHTDGQDLTADNGYGVLFRRTGDEGQTFGETITLDKDAGQQPLAQMVAVSRGAQDDSNNLIYVLWNSDKGCFAGSKTIFARSADNGATFSKPVVVTDCKFDASAQLAASGRNVYVAWNDYFYPSLSISAASTITNIFFRTSTDGGVTFGKPTKLSNSTGESWEPVITAVSSPPKESHAADSDAYVTWIQHTTATNNSTSEYAHRYQVYFGKIAGNGTIIFSGPISNLSSSTSSAGIAAVSGNNGQENVYVSWADSDETGKAGGEERPDIFFKRSSDGGLTFGNVSDLSANSPDFYEQLKLLAAENNVFVVWQVPSTGDTTFNPTLLVHSSDFGNTFDSPIQKLPSNNGFIELSEQELDAVATDGSQEKPAIGLGGNNANLSSNTPSNFYATWRFGSFPGTGASSQDTTNGILFEESKDGGKTFSNAITLTSSSTVLKSNPLVAAYGSDVYVTWAEDTTYGTDILLRRSSDYGNNFAEAQSLANVKVVPEFGPVWVGVIAGASIAGIIIASKASNFLDGTSSKK